MSKQKFWYEMMLRPVGIGCQPSGFVEFDEEQGTWGIVAYDRQLSDKELNDYDMRKWNS